MINTITIPMIEREMNARSRDSYAIVSSNRNGESSQVYFRQLIPGDKVTWSTGIEMVYSGRTKNKQTLGNDLIFLGTSQIDPSKDRLLQISEDALAVTEDGKLAYRTGKPHAMPWSDAIISKGGTA